MELYYDGYSNVPTWLSDANLEDTATLLWHTFHQQYWTYEELIQTPRWNNADKIFLVGQEGNIDHLIDLDPRIHVWDSRVKPGVDRFYSYFWWWWQTVEVNKMQQLTDRLVCPLSSAPVYHFDCIMGGQRHHRNYIYKLILNNKDVREKCLLNYGGEWISGVDCDSKENLKKNKLAEGFVGSLSGTMMLYDLKRTANISTWVPWKIYNQSWFSIIAETDSARNFFTEKTAKPLLAKKMFIIIGAAGALQDLRHIGFRTFDGIIDESYDLEISDQKRWDMAFEQIRLVCSLPPEDIYQKVLPILEHNQRLMLDLDWRNRSISEMRKIVHGH